MSFAIFAVVLIVLALFLLVSVIKIVPQGREFTVERFGRYTRTLKPGIALLTPFIEGIGRRVNMMEQVLDVPQQEVITKDNVSVKVDGIVFIQVMDAASAAYRVDNLTYAISHDFAAATTDLKARLTTGWTISEQPDALNFASTTTSEVWTLDEIGGSTHLTYDTGS